MINNDILAIKDGIVKTLGDDCERVYLFGSYAYGMPRIGGDNPSDYDFYVVLKDGIRNPILVLQDIYWAIAQMHKGKSVDVLANYNSKFQYRSTQPTIERKIAQEGILL
jgi:hypothetical protein